MENQPVSRRSSFRRAMLAFLGIAGSAVLQVQCVKTDDAQAILSDGFNAIFLDFVNARSQDFFNQLFGVDD